MATKKQQQLAPEPEPTSVWVQIPVPAELHRSLKVRAAMDDMSLKDSVIAAIEAYVA